MENLREKVIRKFKDKEVFVGIVGLGYVGFLFMLCYNLIGFRVFGIDIDVEKVRRLNFGESYIEYIFVESIFYVCFFGFEVMIDFFWVKECDVFIFCVLILLNKYCELDMSFVVNIMEVIKLYLCEG